jgi:hypothetical protein
MARRRRGSRSMSGRSLGGCLILFVTLGVLGLLISAVGSCFSAVGQAMNPSQVTHAAASPTPSPSPSPSPAHVVFDIAGSGTGADEEGTSPLFYITPDSDWDLYWSHSCVSPVSVSFRVSVKDGDGSTKAFGDWQDVSSTLPIDQGVMHAHDAGGHERVLRLSVIGPATMRCDWTMKVTASAPTPPTRPAPSPRPASPTPVPPSHSDPDWFEDLF